jgi:hypothetical protein
MIKMDKNGLIIESVFVPNISFPHTGEIWNMGMERQQPFSRIWRLRRAEKILFFSHYGPGWRSVSLGGTSSSFHSEIVCEASMILKASLFLNLNNLEGEISTFLRNVDILLQNSTASPSRRPQSYVV